MPPTKEELMAKAEWPSREALRLHPLYRGKIQMMPKCPVRGLEDFSLWYTPGVAAPCRAIQRDPALVYEFSNKANSIAIVTDGTRVLGLGDIGPEAGLPVMEGKALLFKFLGGVDAVPICLGTKDPEEIIRTVQLLEPPSAPSIWRTSPSPNASISWMRSAPRSGFPSGTTISRARPPSSWPPSSMPRSCSASR